MRRAAGQGQCSSVMNGAARCIQARGYVDSGLLHGLDDELLDLISGTKLPPCFVSKEFDAQLSNRGLRRCTLWLALELPNKLQGVF